MISRERLMNGWFFSGRYRDGMELSADNSPYEPVSLPHNPVDLPLSYFDEGSYQTEFCYRRVLPARETAPGGRLVLRFEAVMAVARVWLDGEYLGDHKGGYTPFEFDVTGRLSGSRPRVLTVAADASERPDTPPFGGQIDYLTYAGIYREVYLDEYAPLSVKNARIWSPDALAQSPDLEAEAFALNGTGKDAPAILNLALCAADGRTVAERAFAVTVPSGGGTLRAALKSVGPVALWSPDSPSLYRVSVSLSGAANPDDSKVDSFETSFGFRTAEFTSDGFLLNGQPLKIRGLNRHQAWPYVGYAMPERAHVKDADILKDELRVNLVRTSHYPQLIQFLDRCDERGLMVFEEIPGWQHIGPADWKDVAVRNVEEMITRDWNHPSIIIWGVRINESADDDAFYTRTNELARRLDPTRQTGGVRYIDKSSLLEDVYTMNDFVHSGGETALRDQRDVTGLDKFVPYLVTEYNGHMYPTKKTDCEERQNEHVFRHLRVQNASYADKHISGAIGWCAFDYNTHCDFGAGDRICHHGVMDIFRLPKFASWVYGSQVDPAKAVVLKPVTHWARGERSIGGVFPLVVLTNCDAISLRFGDYEPIMIKDKEPTLSRLPYPPFVVDFRHVSMEKIGAWGMRWEDLTLTGYVNGKEAAVYRMPKNPLPAALSVHVDDPALRAGEKDATRVVVSVLDQYGNALPFADTVATVTLTGPARVQGPSTLVLRGGSTAFWIESDGKPGTIRFAVSADRLDSRTIELPVL